MTINLVARRSDTAYIIAQDPWSVVGYRAGRTPDQAETDWSATGRIQPLGTAGMGREQQSGRLTGEGLVSNYFWLLMLPWDATVPKREDEVHATQDSTGIERVYDVAYTSRFGYKMEVMLYERQ